MTDYNLVCDMFHNKPDTAYSWLINDFIPKKGAIHMDKFIMLGFDPLSYTAWLWALENTSKPFTPELAKAIELRTKMLYGEDV